MRLIFCLLFLSLFQISSGQFSQNVKVDNGPGENLDAILQLNTVVNTDRITTATQIKVNVIEEDRDPYKVNLWVDIPVTLAQGALTGLGFSLIAEQDKIDSNTVYGLDPLDVNAFDRIATNNYSERAETSSDYFFFAGFPIGLSLFFDKHIRKDWMKVSLLYLQAMTFTSAAYSMSAGLTNRYRPYTYNPDAPMGDRTSLHARNSFFGGHPSVVATSTFFIAKVFADYHPDSKYKAVLYGVASAATLTTGYLRFRAGKHFPTDLLTGFAVAISSGILVPHLHKKKDDDAALNISPFSNGKISGLSINYNF